MPLYFFHVSGLSTFSDKIGTELPSDAAAWSAAVVSCGEILTDLDGRMQDGSEVRITVRNEDERTVAVVRFTGERDPKTRPVSDKMSKLDNDAPKVRATAAIEAALDWIEDVHAPQDYSVFASDLASTALASLEDGDRIGRDLVVRREAIQ